MLDVEEQRKSLELSQEKVAEMAGVSRQYYNSIVNGKRKPSVSLAKRLACILKVEWTIFFSEVVNIQATFRSDNNDRS